MADNKANPKTKLRVGPFIKPAYLAGQFLDQHSKVKILSQKERMRSSYKAIKSMSIQLISTSYNLIVSAADGDTANCQILHIF